MSCAHLTEAGTAEPSTTEVCPDCVAIGNPDWVHLRACLTCGHVGCCDSSPYQHATKHFEQSGHPVMRSVQPGETWRWCFVDEEIG
ncbi:ubiquitin-hydrolase Zn-finger-containing protein [Micromonospora echinaurantiaca]|uniref:Ubiquitin-hydrolase Zn-finger-containing protein n=1 Tax=Micromonospora echinaurantiaca TaxID=47857 RepID=A0A1C5IVR5_9ACTN|nr:UBP-type zinc finger domain-containing protein [Micromonospora echinaurantiaca]SCG62253.1 ubiquitin-hydrolase Zn-finger-containing protein [Micromonospora echinaurantiaca]